MLGSDFILWCFVSKNGLSLRYSLINFGECRRAYSFPNLRERRSFPHSTHTCTNTSTPEWTHTHRAWRSAGDSQMSWKLQPWKWAAVTTVTKTKEKKWVAPYQKVILTDISVGLLTEKLHLVSQTSFFRSASHLRRVEQALFLASLCTERAC